MQKLTSHNIANEDSFGDIFEETVDSRFVFTCVHDNLHISCEKEIDIHKSELDGHGYRCPKCGNSYFLGTSAENTQLLFSDSRDDFPEEVEQLEGPTLFDETEE